MSASEGLCRLKRSARRLNSRTKLMIVLPLIAVLVIILIYFQLFTNPLVDLGIILLYVVASLWNRRKFNRQKAQAEAAKAKKKTQ